VAFRFDKKSGLDSGEGSKEFAFRNAKCLLRVQAEAC